MGKGNKLPEISMKTTKIPEFDEFFDTNNEPLAQVVDWNNELDEKVKELRSLGSDIKKQSTTDAPPAVGELKVEVKDDTVHVHLEKDGNPLAAKALDKVTKEYFTMVEKKAKLLTKRIKQMQKLPGLENATLRLGGKKPYHVEVAGDADALKEHKKNEVMEDMGRSIVKFNDRADILAMQLNGPVTLAEAVSALMNTVKEEFKKKGKALKLAIEDGMPKIDGLPDDVEDFFPSLVARAWNLLKATFEFIKGLMEQIPALQEKFEAIIAEAKEMPGKVKDAAAGANLGGMEIIKAGKNTAANVKALSGAPGMLTTLLKTLKDTGLELTNAIQGGGSSSDAPADSAPAAADPDSSGSDHERKPE
jgi:hypothetical protein